MLSGSRAGWSSLLRRPPAWRSSARRMRWTSTPITPERSPWRPNAVIARRARSRISPSLPSKMARRIASRSSSRSILSPEPSKRSSSIPFSRASVSAARKKWRSKSSSKIRRSSCDLAMVAARDSRKSRWSVQLTSSRAANASRISEVPTATPSERRSSKKASRLAAVVDIGLAGARQLDRDPLGDDIDVRAVLDEDAHGALEGLAVDVVGADQQQRARPVDRLGDRGRLLQIELAHHRDDLYEPAGEPLVELRGVQPDDLELAVDGRIVEPEIEAATLQRLGELAGVVRGEDDDRLGACLDHAQLRDGDLEVGEDLEQHRLELLVGLVDLIDQQDDRVLGADRLEQGAGEQELLPEDVRARLLPPRLLVTAGLSLDPEQLLAVVPLIQSLGLVEALVALEPNEPALGG